MTAIDKIARYILLSMMWIGAFGISGQSMSLLDNTILLSSAILIGAGIFSGAVGWRPSGNLDKATRYGFLVVIWAFMLLMHIINQSNYNVNPFPWHSSTFTLIPIVALGAVLYTTYKLFPRYPNELKAAAPRPAMDDFSKEKRKNGELNPLDILTEDDLYDLRQEIKDHLRERMLSGSDGELSSLDALLDAQDRKITQK